jgi:hypothetical protein
VGVPGWIHRGIEVLLDSEQGVRRIERVVRRTAVAVEVGELRIAAGEVRRIAEEGVHRTAAEEEGHHTGCLQVEERCIGCSRVEARRSRIESDHVGIDQDLVPIDPVAEVEHHKVLEGVVDHKAAVLEVRRKPVEEEVRSIHLVEVVRCIRLVVVVDSYCFRSTT